MAKAPAKPKPELTRAQQLTMGQAPKKETTDGQEGRPQADEPSAVGTGDQSAEEAGDGDVG